MTPNPDNRMSGEKNMKSNDNQKSIMTKEQEDALLNDPSSAQGYAADTLKAPYAPEALNEALAAKDKFFWELGQIAMTIDGMGKIEGTGWSDSHQKVLELVALREEVNKFVKHVGAPNFKEAVEVLLRTKQQDEDKIAEMFGIIKATGADRDQLAGENAELKLERYALAEQCANFRILLLELCEKMEAGLSGEEETKRARAMLGTPML